MSIKSFNLVIKNRTPSFHKTIIVDPDKSISIRSFLLGAICQNISIAKNVLESEDVLTAINSLKKLGVKITRFGSGNYKIFGKGLGSLFIKKNSTLNFGNSGTLARLLIGILSTTPNIEVKLTGDHSLKKRNMRKIVDLMSNFGTSFKPKNKFNFPLKLISSEIPVGFKYKAGVSAQLKSAVILAGLNSFGVTEVIDQIGSRDHTENILLNNNKVMKIKKEKKKKKITVYGKNFLNPLKIQVPGDSSSAAFFTALTVLNKKSSIKIKNVGLNPTRIGFYNIIKNSGAKIKFSNLKKINNEIRGDVIARSSKLKKIIAEKNYYVNSTDEYPILFVIASLTKGKSIFRGIKDLANKESNRILQMQNVLKQIGIKSEATSDQIKIYGKGMINARDKKINIPNLGDHRICMSAFILASLTGAKTSIKNFETVYTSCPSFLKIMKKLGLKFEIH